MAQDPVLSNTSGDIPLLPTAASQLALVKYVQDKSQLMFKTHTLRERFERVDRLYQREVDWTQDNQRAAQANKYGDSSKLQNLTVPVVMPQVKAAVTYQSSVFLTGTPIFGVAAPPAYIAAGVMLESIIEEEQVRAGWVRNLMLFLTDGFKYNYSAVEVDWKTINVASLTNVANKTAADVKQELWSGNYITRLDPYNTFHDPSVCSADVPTCAEFAGYTKKYSRTRFKKFVADLKYKINVTEAYNSPSNETFYSSPDSSYYVPKINPNSHMEEVHNTDSGENWAQWMDLAGAKKSAIDYKDFYLVTVMYAKIAPAEFKLDLPARNTPQIFRFIVVNNKVLLHVERVTNAHNMLPILFGVPLEDGMGFEDKSLAENAEPFQSTSSTLMNSMLAARRRAVSDRIAYDPSRVPQHLMDKPGVARIPMRAASYGSPVADAFYQFPFRDEQAGLIMQEVQTVLALGNEINGQNRARQGQFVKGNKTQREFDTVMANANGRDQITAILLEDQVFTPLKEIIKTNILQYHGAATIFSTTKNLDVQVDPVLLRNAVMAFKVSDGLTPTDKLMDADSFTVALQTLASSPQISSGYNVPSLFSYLIKQRGADITPFEKSAEQLAYEQALQAWQQAVVTAMQSAPAGTPPPTPEQLPPQPLPEQYGYKPQGLSATVSPKVDKQTSNVNNITNNITNNQ